MLRYTCLCLALIMPAMADAKLYKIIDESGHVIFTDTAPSIDTKEYHPGQISAIENPEFNQEKIKAKKKAEEQDDSDNE